MAAVEHLCSKAFLLENGSVAFTGSAKEAVEYYLSEFSGENPNGDSSAVDLSVAVRSPRTYRPLLKRLELSTADGRPLSGGLKLGAPLRACISFDLEEPTDRFDVMLGFDNHLGQRVFTASSQFEPGRVPDVRVGRQTLVCHIPSLTLVPGIYRIKVNLTVGNVVVDSIADAARLNIVASDYYGTGKVVWNGFFVLKQNWHLQDGEPSNA
jgi:lipopolysaccharide transport system ATP-binding protein